jgi:hypothetical protein
MRSDVIDTVSLPHGYRYAFTPGTAVLGRLADLVHLEHQCCRFLSFKIIVESGDSPIQLEVTGPPEARATIADFFGTQTDEE